jgi:hypothetical protein
MSRSDLIQHSQQLPRCGHTRRTQLSQASAHNRSCPGVDLVENDLAVRARSVDLLHV